MKRKILAFFLILSMLVSMMPGFAEPLSSVAATKTDLLDEPVGTADEPATLESVDEYPVMPIANTTYTVNIVWDDGNNVDGLRPSSIDVWLDPDFDIMLQTYTTLSGSSTASQWTHSWSIPSGNYVLNLFPTYLSGYETFGPSYSTNTWTVTFYHEPTTVQPPVEPTTTEVTAKVEWDDDNDAAGMRPETVMATLYGGSERVGEPVALNVANSWEFTWDKLPDDVLYSVEFAAVGTVYSYYFSTSYNGTTQIYTGKYLNETTSLTVTIDWDDSSNRDGLRDTVLVQLLTRETSADFDNPTADLTESNNWTYTWENLPAYFHYYVDVPFGIGGYSFTAQQVSDTQWRIVASHTPVTPEFINVSASVRWLDGDDTFGTRSGDFQVQLYANGAPSGDPVTLSADNSWKHTWSLPTVVEGEGQQIYAVKPVSEVPNYVGSVAGSSNNVVLVNTLYGTCTVQFDWNDGGNPYRPDVVHATLYDSLYNAQNFTIAAADGWKYVLSLPLYTENDQRINYYLSMGVGEENYGFDVPFGDLFTSLANAVTVQANLCKVTDVTVRKVWKDEDDQDGIRPDAITVVLLKDGQPYDTVILNEANGWRHYWEELPAYPGVNYTVTEESVPDYVPSMTTTGIPNQPGWTVTFTNTHTPETKALTATKVWTDEIDDAAIARPDSIEVALLADGEAIATATLSEENDWSCEWEDLPVYNKGQLIEYTVDEVKVPEGYTKTVSETETGFTVTNAYTGPKKTPVPTAKPTAKPTEEPTIKPTEEPTEAPAPEPTEEPTEFPTPEPTEEPTEEPTKEPTSEPTEKPTAMPVPFIPAPTEAPVANFIDIAGQKTWVDDEDAAGLRPEEIVVYLLRDGQKIAETTATAASGWSYSFTDLPDIDVTTGKAYTYAVSEQIVKGYYGYAVGYDLTNVLLPEESDPVQPRQLTQEELVELIRLYDYSTPLLGSLLGTGLEVPAYPFVAAALGLVALVLLTILGRKRKEH